MKEPSVLDYIKALLTPWKGKPPVIPSEPQDEAPAELHNQPLEMERPAWAEALLDNSEELPEEPANEGEIEPVSLPADEREGRKGFPWSILLALVLAIAAQLQMEPPDQKILPAVLLYILAAAFAVLGIVRREWAFDDLPEFSAKPFGLSVKRMPIYIAVVLLLASFGLFGGNRFTALNLTLWLSGLVFLIYGFYLPENNRLSLVARARSFYRKPSWSLKIDRWTLLVVLCVAVVAFFRFYHLAQVPGEMFSDHAEKLLDISDVLSGKFSIFFPRNTGREAIQMYMCALVAIVFGTKISFLTLKIGTTLAGFFTLPYIYLLGKELGNRRVGLLAFLLAGIAYWPNVISRVGLRFPLYPLFAAPALYYLIRGLRRRQRNDFIWSGIALGMGLHGYTSARIMPLVLVVCIGVYLLHRAAQGNRKETISGLVILTSVSLAIFLPLFRYMLDNPEMFWYRVLTRTTNTESAYPGSIVVIFLKNLWNSLVMFFYNDGQIWVHSVPYRPALDVIGAALFFLGLVLVVVRYLRKHNWIDLFMLLSIPLLMLPSILSLAFPDENPSLNRTGAAIVPVFILAAYGIESIYSALRERLAGKMRVIVPSVLVVGLVFVSASQNFDLVFRQYSQEFLSGVWNTSDLGHVIRSFADSVGSPDTAYVIPYPYWVDTRLVGIEAGYGVRDFALDRSALDTTLADTREKLFIVDTQDSETVQDLETLYPDGSLYLYKANLPGKDFLEYYVPPTRP